MTRADTIKLKAAAPMASPTSPRLFTREWGSGRPILFVHSWALDSGMWQAQFVDLAERGFRCIGYDRRGHGRSDVPPDGYDLDTLADDLARVLGGIDAERVGMVTHSMGAAEVLRYVERYGTGRIDRLVLVAPATPCLVAGPDNPLGAPVEVFDALRREWREDFPAWIDANKAPFFLPDTSPATIEWVVRMMERTPLPVALATNAGAVAADLRAALARVDRPTLVIQGDRDASAPLDLTGRPTAAGIPDARLTVYEGAPHGLFVTHAARLSRDIADWLSA